MRQSQIKAAVQVNTALLEFYWDLGRDIVNMKAEQAWGSGFFEQLSLDLRDAFSQAKGFSERNIRYAFKWHSFYSQDDSFLQQLVAEMNRPEESLSERDDTILHQVGAELKMPEKFGLVPWGHHIQIITKCKTVEEAMFYIEKTVEGNWSRRRLDDELDGKLFYRQGTAITNFATQLPATQSQLAAEILKDPYNFDFLAMTQGYTERQLEEALAHNITRFLLELGRGFGLLICKSKDETTVKWSFQGINRPIGVAAYELKEVLDKTLSDNLPSAKDIEQGIE